MTAAAVMTETGKPLQIVEMDLEPRRKGEVLIHIGATGVCHSDLSVFTGRLPNPLPVIGRGAMIDQYVPERSRVPISPACHH